MSTAPQTDPALDLAYNARDTVGPELFGQLMARYRAESDAAVDGLPGHKDVVYDKSSGERLDLWGPGTIDDPRPVFVFVHGGYWRALSKADSAFMAGMLDKQGVATAVIDYTLSPTATLEEIVRQVRAAVDWVHRNAHSHGLDATKVFVGGSSAGGHLAAMALTSDTRIAGGFLVSGLYDIRPLVRTHVNAWLELDEDRAAELSPGLAAAPAQPVVLLTAEHEASGFHDQAKLLHTAWGKPVLELPGRNHFDVILDFADPDSSISRALLELIEQQQG